jgi:hypothetical protein
LKIPILGNPNELSKSLSATGIPCQNGCST